MTEIIVATIGAVALIVGALFAYHQWKLTMLREAFLEERNDKQSRIEAWKSYRRNGGVNYVSFINELEK